MISKTIQLYRSSFEGLSGPIWLLSLVNLINRSGTMVVPFMSMYLTQSKGLALTSAGTVLLIYGIGSIIGAWLGGRLTDRFGYHKVQFFSLFGGGLLFFLLAMMDTFFWICVVCFILGLINEAFRPPNMAAIGVFSTDENRTRSSSLVRLSVNLGWAFGGGLGGILASYNYKLLFIVDGCTNLFAALVVWFYLPNVTLEYKKNEETQKRISIFKDKQFVFFIFLKLLFATCFFQVFTTLPVFLKTQLGLSEIKIGWTMAMNGLFIALFEMLIVYRLAPIRKDLVMMAIGTFLLSFSYLIYNLLHINAFLLATISTLIFTIAEIIAMPFMLTWWLNRSNDQNRGSYAAWYTMAFAAAHVIGPSTGSYIADHFGFSILWWSVAGICLITSIGYLILNSFENKIPSIK